MRAFLIVLAVILAISWVISVFFFALGKFLHLLLILAVVAFFLGRRKRKKEARHEVD